MQQRSKSKNECQQPGCKLLPHALYIYVHEYPCIGIKLNKNKFAFVSEGVGVVYSVYIYFFVLGHYYFIYFCKYSRLFGQLNRDNVESIFSNQTLVN